MTEMWSLWYPQELVIVLCEEHEIGGFKAGSVNVALSRVKWAN